MFFCNDPVFPALFPLHLQIWSGAACILFRNSLLIWFSHPPGWVRSCVVLAVWEGLKVCGEGEGRGGKAEARWGRIQRKSCIRKTLQPGQHFCLGLVQASHCVRVCVNPLELGRGGGFTGGRGVGLPQRNLAVNPSPWDRSSDCLRNIGLSEWRATQLISFTVLLVDVVQIGCMQVLFFFLTKINFNTLVQNELGLALMWLVRERGGGLMPREVNMRLILDKGKQRGAISASWRTTVSNTWIYNVRPWKELPESSNFAYFMHNQPPSKVVTVISIYLHDTFLAYDQGLLVEEQLIIFALNSVGTAALQESEMKNPQAKTLASLKNMLLYSKVKGLERLKRLHSKGETT